MRTLSSTRIWTLASLMTLWKIKMIIGLLPGQFLWMLRIIRRRISVLFSSSSSITSQCSRIKIRKEIINFLLDILISSSRYSSTSHDLILVLTSSRTPMKVKEAIIQIITIIMTNLSILDIPKLITTTISIRRHRVVVIWTATTTIPLRYRRLRILMIFWPRISCKTRWKMWTWMRMSEPWSILQWWRPTLCEC